MIQSATMELIESKKEDVGFLHALDVLYGGNEWRLAYRIRQISNPNR